MPDPHIHPVLSVPPRIVKTALCQEVSATDLGETEMEPLTMDSLWGVFWIIYYGFIVSFVFIVLEWVMSGMMEVQPEQEGVSRGGAG